MLHHTSVILGCAARPPPVLQPVDPTTAISIMLCCQRWFAALLYRPCRYSSTPPPAGGHPYYLRFLLPNSCYTTWSQTCRGLPPPPTVPPHRYHPTTLRHSYYILIYWIVAVMVVVAWTPTDYYCTCYPFVILTVARRGDWRQ